MKNSRNKLKELINLTVESIFESIDTQIRNTSKSDMENQTDILKDFVDLGLPSGTLWSKFNLGAEKPEEYGNYYKWKEWNDDLPEHLEVPDRDQWFELRNYTKSKWDTLNGVNGRIFTGPNGNSIFIPAYGNISPSGAHSHIGQCSNNWCNTYDKRAFHVYFDRRYKCQINEIPNKYLHLIKNFVRPVLKTR